MNTPLVTTDAVTMSSREVAELTSKRHDHVLRDIDSLFKSFNEDESRSPNLGSGIRESFYTDTRGRQYREYVMTKSGALLVITKYDDRRRWAVIRRWKELEEARANPAPATPQLPADSKAAVELLDSISNVLAKIPGMDMSTAIAGAVAPVQKMTGVDVSPIIDALPHLPATENEYQHNATSLGRLIEERYGEPTRPTEVNSMLEEAGLQHRLTVTRQSTKTGELKTETVWAVTDQGLPFAHSRVIGKNGTRTQLQWSARVIDELARAFGW